MVCVLQIHKAPDNNNITTTPTSFAVPFNSDPKSAGIVISNRKKTINQAEKRALPSRNFRYSFI
jgi:3,4-dihydroxy-2-butanone 4-phosphate synthase